MFFIRRNAQGQQMLSLCVLIPEGLNSFRLCWMFVSSAQISQVKQIQGRISSCIALLSKFPGISMADDFLQGKYYSVRSKGPTD
jgi:hypothetical protein